MTGKAFFDTAFFIYALENGDCKARDFILYMAEARNVGISIITVAEYLTGVIKNNKPEAAHRFESFLEDLNFEIKDVDKKVAYESAGIRARYPFFKQMDALIIASAKVAEADVFYTNDKQLKQYKDEQLEIVLYDECPNSKTIAAFREADEIKNHPEKYKSYDSIDELMKDLLSDDE